MLRQRYLKDKQMKAVLTSEGRLYFTDGKGQMFLLTAHDTEQLVDLICQCKDESHVFSQAERTRLLTARVQG